MAAVLQSEEDEKHAGAAVADVVVVGSGPVGMRVARELDRRAPGLRVVLYGDEPWEPYNRVRLSSFLAGDIDWQALNGDIGLPTPSAVECRYGCAVIEILREHRCVRDAQGRLQPYRHLVLATGSTPHIPELPGIRLPNVYAFRNLGDAQRLFARRVRSRHTIVLGGGLLGLEAARAMRRFHTEVTLIDHAMHLMAQQLDAQAAALLQAHVEALGIEVITGDAVRAVLGVDAVEGVYLRSGRRINCDTLIVATGIRPNIDLARRAGIAVSRGIRVDDELRTSDPHIRAVGECAEHRDRLYGIVAPGFEQAAVVAQCIAGGAARYEGSLAVARLKVVGLPVLSFGAVTEHDKLDLARQWRYRADGVYRKIVVERDRLIGAIATGDMAQTSRLQEAVINRARVWPWQIVRFLRTGALWAEDERVTSWPAHVTVCHCTGVTCGTLRAAIAEGHGTFEALQRATSASTVCGSCKPLVQTLLGGTASVEPARASRTLATTTAISALLSLLVLTFALPYATSVQHTWHWDVLWRESFWKQVSGYTLLALSVIATALSLRKRWPRLRFADFAYWRVAHVALGVAALVALAAHTGGRLGDQLNFLLSSSFLGVAALGTGGAWIVAREHRWPPARARRWRERLVWSHILLLWPLPLLLGFHVLKTYYF